MLNFGTCINLEKGQFSPCVSIIELTTENNLQSTSYLVKTQNNATDPYLRLGPNLTGSSDRLEQTGPSEFRPHLLFLRKYHIF